jgi:long-chain acyl-CoA synthetase
MRHGGRPLSPTREITRDLTLPKLLVERAGEFGHRRIAMREKEYGIWRPVTWADYLARVRELTLGLSALGLRRGDKVALIGRNRPEGLWAEMAVLALGGVAVWLYQDALADEIQYIVDHSDARFAVAEGQEEVDKLLAIRHRTPRLERILWDDPKGLRGYDNPILVGMAEVAATGARLAEADPDQFSRMVAAGHGDDIALLFYTSGTTAQPKGALLSHFNLLKMGQQMMAVDPASPDDDFVSFLPFAWIGEQMMSVSCGLLAGFTINFPEEPETVQQNIREIAPQVIFSPPRIYEQMVRTTQVRALDAPWLKRMVYEWGLRVGYAIADRRFAKEPVPILLRIAGALADVVVLRKLRDHLGMARVRDAYTGGAALGPDHFRFFHAIGVNLKQIYGQTEIAGISVLHRDGDVKFDTVGTPLPETEVRIAPDGEILSRGPCVFQGYYKMPEETVRTLRDGWLHSGDIGFIDPDGHLVVFDRRKDVMILAGGSRFAPQYLETRLKFSPYIKDAWIIGDGRPYVTAVICIDAGVVGRWAEERQITYLSYQDLSQKPEVLGLVTEAVRRVNAGLPEEARIRRFVNLHKEFDADDAELTRTRKLRRAFLEERYAEVVVGLYSDASVIPVITTITYEDGRTSTSRIVLHVVTVSPEAPGVAA